nr:hypothetical protein Iba_chr05cCG8240 [Ipomoea batatas]GME08934.1 hypothetical protein Iba_scaffold8023CG0220 [Ipomoea batatas]GME15563.1 hypothetical protein Iba_scaffold16325CG0020 [Ipomoea batatas]
MKLWRQATQSRLVFINDTLVDLAATTFGSLDVSSFFGKTGQLRQVLVVGGELDWGDDASGSKDGGSIGVESLSRMLMSYLSVDQPEKLMKKNTTENVQLAESHKATELKQLEEMAKEKKEIERRYKEEEERTFKKLQTEIAQIRAYHARKREEIRAKYAPTGPPTAAPTAPISLDEFERRQDVLEKMRQAAIAQKHNQERQRRGAVILEKMRQAAIEKRYQEWQRREAVILEKTRRASKRQKRKEELKESMADEDVTQAETSHELQE